MKSGKMVSMSSHIILSKFVLDFFYAHSSLRSMTKFATLIAVTSLPLLLAGCTASTVNSEDTSMQSSSVSSEETAVEHSVATDTGAMMNDTGAVMIDVSSSDSSFEDPLDNARD